MGQVFKNEERFTRKFSIFYDFLRRVKDAIKTLQDKSCGQIRVRYLDDENCYANLEGFHVYSVLIPTAGNCSPHMPLKVILLNETERSRIVWWDLFIFILFYFF